MSLFDLSTRHDLLEILWTVAMGLEANTPLEMIFERVRPLPRVEVLCASQKSAFDFPEGVEPQVVPKDVDLGIPNLPPPVLRRHTELIYIVHTFLGGAVQCQMHVTLIPRPKAAFSIIVDRHYPGFDKTTDGMQTFCRVENGNDVSFKLVYLGGSHL